MNSSERMESTLLVIKFVCLGAFVLACLFAGSSATRTHIERAYANALDEAITQTGAYMAEYSSESE